MALPAPAAAQRCPAGPSAPRLVAIGGGFAAAETAVVIARHDDWWTTPRTRFHFTSGGSASRGQDLWLHGTIAYQAAQAATLLFDWACVPRGTAGWLGAAFGVAVGLPKEIGDGLHADKGFALDDVGATAAGALLPALHRAAPVTKLVAVKVFYWPSGEYRNRAGGLPSLENDYAGQRFFFAIQPGALPRGGGPWPDWLGVAVGHGVPTWVTSPPTHDWYVTLDLRFAGLPIPGNTWRRLAAILDQWHVPLPGVRFGRGETRLGIF